MSVGIYIDVDVHAAVAAGLRRRGVDVLTAIEDGRRTLPDEQLLKRARELERVFVTHALDFIVIAAQWRQANQHFTGIARVRRRRTTVGMMVRDLELIAKATDPGYWLNRVEYLPY